MALHRPRRQHAGGPWGRGGWPEEAGCSAQRRVCCRAALCCSAAAARRTPGGSRGTAARRGTALLARPAPPVAPAPACPPACLPRRRRRLCRRARLCLSLIMPAPPAPPRCHLAGPLPRKGHAELARGGIPARPDPAHVRHGERVASCFAKLPLRCCTAAPLLLPVLGWVCGCGAGRPAHVRRGE